MVNCLMKFQIMSDLPGYKAYIVEGVCLCHYACTYISDFLTCLSLVVFQLFQTWSYEIPIPRPL